MVKTRRKITTLRVLQVLFYALGFPLFVHLVMLVARPLSDSNLTTGINGSLSILIAAAMWVVVIIVQLLMRAICRKNRMARAVIVALVAAVITIAPILYSDFLLKGKYEEDAKAAAEKGVETETYEIQITEYADFVAETNAEINAFLEVFNIEFASKDYNRGGANTDLSEVTYDPEKDVYLSPNGMYSDGYRFGYLAAKEVLTDYYSNKLAYEAEGKDIDVELASVIAELESNPSSDWNKYKNGASASSFAMEGFEYITSSTEYEDAYGEDGSATKYYLTEERLNSILSVVGEKFGDNAALKTLLGVFAGNGDGSGEGIGAIVDKVLAILNKDLDVDTLLEVVNGIELSGQSLGGMLAGLLGEEGATELTKDMLFGLLVNFSSYQSPMTYPVYYFIEDANLRDYAYAKYYATVHGATLGSVLVGTPDANGNEYVGEITMSTSGTLNPYSGEDLLYMFNKWDFDQKLQNEYYPIFAVREIALKMSAVIVFTLMAAYFFTALIDKQYAKLTLKTEGGNR